VSGLTGLANVAMGVAYLLIGVIAAIDLVRGWRVLGLSHFGLAFVGLAFTCGPHHLHHGSHILFDGRIGQPIDLVTVLVGLPAGAIFVILRTEAFLGGRGDRQVEGTPWWLRVAPTAAAVYATLLIVWAFDLASGPLALSRQMLPNALLIGVYGAIGWVLLRTQLRNHRMLGTWSLSGLSLMAIFPTCAVMHAAWVLHGAAGDYAFDQHGFIATWSAVPAGLYFLWVVRALYRDALQDWNRPSPEQVMVVRRG
jgi:hypothetical protein